MPRVPRFVFRFHVAMHPFSNRSRVTSKCSLSSTRSYKGVSTFLICCRHFQRSGSLLTQCFDVTRLILDASLLSNNSKVCRKESSIFVSTFVRVTLLESSGRKKIVSPALRGYRLATLVSLVRTNQTTIQHITLMTHLSSGLTNHFPSKLQPSGGINESFNSFSCIIIQQLLSLA